MSHAYYPELPGWAPLWRSIVKTTFVALLFFTANGLVFYGAVLLWPTVVCALIFGPLVGWAYWAVEVAAVRFERWRR